MPYTMRPWWTVDDASALLRVDRKTLYDAIKYDGFPHSRVGPYLRIPCEALRLTPHPDTKARNWHHDDAGQMTLPLDVSCLIPVRRYRNTRELVKAWDYERALWKAHPVNGVYAATDDVLPDD